MEPKTIIGIGLVLFIVAGLAFLYIRNKRMTKDLVIDCLKQACGRRGDPKEVLIHSDRGSQYCSLDYQKELKQREFTSQ